MPIQAFRPERFRTYGMLMKCLYIYWIVCDLDSVWNQADGEPQRVAIAK